MKRNSLLFEPKTVENIITITGHAGAIYDVLYFNPSIFTSSADKYVAQWNMETGEQTNFAVKLEYSAYGIAHNPENNLLAIANNRGQIHVIDLKQKKEVRLLEQHKSSIFSLTFNPYKKQFYSGDKEGYFCAWDENFELLITLPFDCGKIREIALSEDGSHIAICGQEEKVYILETEFFNTVNEFKAHKEGVNCALFDKEELYTGGKDAYIRKWNWKTGEKIAAIPAHNFAVYDLEFIDNKKKIVSVSFDKSIKIWNSKDLSIIERIEYRNKGHRHCVNRIAKINEEKFATVSDDRKIKIWKLKE
ncbi:MAG: hypothetical protein WC994_01595 [Brumimicrobium sp.]